MKRTQIKNAGRRRKNRWGSRALAALLCAVMLFSAADLSIFAQGTAAGENSITEPQEEAEPPLTPETQEEEGPPQDEETEAEPAGQENPEGGDSAETQGPQTESPSPEPTEEPNPESTQEPVPESETAAPEDADETTPAPETPTPESTAEPTSAPEDTPDAEISPAPEDTPIPEAEPSSEPEGEPAEDEPENEEPEAEESENEESEELAVFSANGISLPEEYVWEGEDGALSLTAAFSGEAGFDGEISEGTVPEFTVTIEDGEDSGKEADQTLLTLSLHLSVDGKKLDISACKVKVSLKADTGILVPQVAAIDADPDEDLDGRITEISVIAEDETKATLPVSDDPAAAEFELSNADDDIMLISVGESSNPSFLLQHYYWFPEVQKATGGNAQDGSHLEFVDSSANLYTNSADATPQPSATPATSPTPKPLTNSDTETSLRAENRLFNVELKDIGDEHRLTTKDALVPLFDEESTNYIKDSQLRYMSHLYNKDSENDQDAKKYSSNYTLSEIWIYQPKLKEEVEGSGKYEIDTENEDYIEIVGGEVRIKPDVKDEDIPFIVYPVPVGTSTNELDNFVRFTNNKANSHLTIPFNKRVEISNSENPTEVQDSAGNSYLKVYTHTDSIDGETTIDVGTKYQINESFKHSGDGYPYTYTILIQTGTIIRLVTAGTTQDDYEQDANFFDYNIGDGFVYNSADDARSQTNGQSSVTARNNNSNLYMYTNEQGINNADNYKGNGTKIAFGNDNTQTGLGAVEWNSNTLNKYNSGTNHYKGATFGLVKGLDYGTVQGLPIVEWANGINGVDWFSAASVTGKFVYPAGGSDSYSLGFNRKGSTYTLSSVTHGGNKIEHLRSFTNTNPEQPDRPIMSNEFWPMDDVGSTEGHDFLFGSSSTNRIAIGKGTAEGRFPESDVPNDHNSYFGMSYHVEFTIEPGYAAPLAYWFYGDDDMWVFLEKLDENGNVEDFDDGSKNKLVADIGGVHSSIGEYVNLWDYVEKVSYEGTPQSYRLTIFYTERGASGSTCYMRFSVPMTTTEPVLTTRDDEVVIEKQELDSNGNLITHENEENPANTNERVIFQGHEANWWPNDINDVEENLNNGTLKMADGYFLFKIRMGNIQSEYPDQLGQVYQDVYDYAIYDKTKTPDHTASGTDEQRLEWGSIGDQATSEGSYYFALRSNEYIVITNLPDGTYYSVEEVSANNYVTGWRQGSHIHQGAESVDTLGEQVNYTNTAGNPTALSAENQNYVLFINSPALKTEATPGDGKPAHEGEEIEYNIYYVNDLSETGDIVILDRLDPGVDFVGAKFGEAGDGTGYWTLTDEQKAGLEDGSMPYAEWHQIHDGYTDIVRYHPKYRYIEEDWKDYDQPVKDKLKSQYGEPGPTVIWTRRGTKTENGGAVSLKVRVNEKAGAEEEVPGKFNTLVPRVENQAGVLVGNSSFVLTDIVENPSWAPEKTETQVDHTANADKFENDVETNPDMEDIPGGVRGPLVRPGDKIKYRITWRNYESQPAFVQIRDPLDEHVTYVENSAKAYEYEDESKETANEASNVIFNYDSTKRELRWFFFPREPDAEGYVEFQVTVDEGASEVGHVWNWGFVQVGNQSEMETQHVRNDTPENPHKSEISPGEHYGVKVGDVIWYEISYNNFEAVPVTVTITDRLDEGLDYVEGSATDGGTYDENSRTVKWMIANVSADSGGTVRFAARVNKNALTWAENTATVQIGDNPEQRTETVPNPVPHKESDPVSGTPVELGRDIKYTITYKNTKDVPAMIKIRDPIDKGLTVREETISDGGVWTRPENPGSGGGEINWTLEEVPAGEEGSVSFTATVNENAISWVENTAYVDFDNTGEVKTETVEHPVPDGDPHKTEITPGDGETVKIGDEITYRIIYENDTKDTVDVKIRDPLDKGNTFVSASDGGVYDAASHTVTWTIEDVPPRGWGYVELTVRVNENSEIKHRVDNTAYVAVGNNPEQQTETVTNPEGEPHKIEVSPGDGKPVGVGQEITYEIIYVNDTKEVADVLIRDPLDPGVDFVSASDGGVYDTSSHTVIWTIKDVAPETGGYVTLTVRVNEKAMLTGSVKNQAFVKVGNGPEVGTEIPQNPVNPPSGTGDLSVTKSVTGAGDRNKDWHFRVELSDKSINGTYGEMTFTDGIAEFTLKHGESKTATGLPLGTTYTVTEEEANQDGYFTSSTGTEGTINGDGSAHAEFVNSTGLPPDFPPAYPPTTTPPTTFIPTPTPETTPTPVPPVTSPPTPTEPPAPPESPTDTPPTGDGRDIMPWLAACGISALGIVITSRLMKKSRCGKNRR